MRPAPSGSAMTRLSPESLPMNAKFSGSAASTAPSRAASDEKTAGDLEIGLDLVAGGHLDCRYAHAAYYKATQGCAGPTIRQIPGPAPS